MAGRHREFQFLQLHARSDSPAGYGNNVGLKSTHTDAGREHSAKYILPLRIVVFYYWLSAEIITVNIK